MSLLAGIAIPSVYLWLWYTFYPNTINEYLLITHKTVVANGFIVKAEQIEDYVETNNDRTIEKTINFTFEYNFTLPTGKTITSFGSEVGPLPDHLVNVETTPYPVEVEYLPNDPTINRVFSINWIIVF